MRLANLIYIMFWVALEFGRGSMEYVHLSVLKVYSVPSDAFISEGAHASCVWYTLVWAVQDSLLGVQR